MPYPPGRDGHKIGGVLLAKSSQPSPNESAASAVQSIQSNRPPDPMKKMLSRTEATAALPTVSQRKLSNEAHSNHDEPATGAQQGILHAPDEQ
ncbi:hypothetical protein LTR56_018457 [Elasticomyces elasticus]|nr:hypothetical protein LTR56_018457 [Elasticomyces elasticus]KAK5751729.1 hypothetical protein LTS12_018204 [Elasticomyces elasticus]